MHDRSTGSPQMDFARQIIVAASDMSLYVDKQGVITDMVLGQGPQPDPAWDLVGKRWEDTAAPDSQPKVRELLADTLAGRPTRPRQINLRGQGGLTVPFRFSTVLAGDQLVALGRDLSPGSAVHRQMVAAQQAADREFERIRQANSRYRILFNVTSEGVLVVDLTTLRVVEANQAAAVLLDQPHAALNGRQVASLFDAQTWPLVHNQVVAVQAGGRSVGVPVSFAALGRTLVVAVSLFRQGNAEHALVRLNAAGGQDSGTLVQQRRTLAVLQALPDGFVVVDQDMVVLSANTAFCEMAQCPNENHVVGQPLEKWLGRPGVDTNIILSNLRERGVLTQFSTVVRGEHGVVQPAVLSAVSALDARVPCMGFVIRPAAPTSQPADPELGSIPRSHEHLRGLVGRVPLKEIVRESADLIEKLCIEAALRVSSDNRANAAMLLGLSRQGLYSKLRRHGLGHLDPDMTQDS